MLSSRDRDGVITTDHARPPPSTLGESLVRVLVIRVIRRGTLTFSAGFLCLAFFLVSPRFSLVSSAAFSGLGPILGPSAKGGKKTRSRASKSCLNILARRGGSVIVRLGNSQELVLCVLTGVSPLLLTHTGDQ